MATKILDLNEGDFEFSLSKVKQKDWEKLAFCVLSGAVEDLKTVRDAELKVSIRDNTAKVKISFSEGNFTEICLHVDEYGIVEHNYEDSISHTWQDMMGAYFGNDYMLEWKC